MAMANPDLMKGLRPFNTPRSELCFDYEVTAGGRVNVFEPVSFDRGAVAGIADTTDVINVAGVAMGEGDATDHVSVCTDPYQIYSILVTGTGSDYASLLGELGNFASLIGCAAADVNNRSQCTLNFATIVSTPVDGDMHLQIVAMDPTIDMENASAGECRVLVKLTNPAFACVDKIS